MAKKTKPSAESESAIDQSRTDKLWLLKFGIEASTRYHEARRARLEGYSALVKVISIVGSVLAFVGLSGQYPDIPYVEVTVAIAVAVVAFVNLLDLVFNVDGRARLHTDLYRRFKYLQEKLSREEDNWNLHLNEWVADAQAIRVDEPPTFYALYVGYFNLAVEKFGADSQYKRSITKTQHLLRHFRRYQPQDF